MSDEERPPEGLALTYLRELEGVPRKKHAALLGHANDTLLGKLERGDKDMGRDLLVAYVEPIGQSPEAVDALLSLYPLIKHVPPEQQPSPAALNRHELKRIDRTCLAAAAAMVQALRAEMVRRKMRRKAEAQRRDAKERFPDLKAAGPRERRQLVETFPRYRTWAMAERACEASIRAAADRADVALELALFALFIAERILETFYRPRTEGYCWGHIGNALRVKEDFDAADRAFVRTWNLWGAGADSDPGLLQEWRLLSLEASLRREQHRFPEALESLGRASACCRGNKLAFGRILLKKSNVLEQMGNLEGALATLDEAVPQLDGTEEPRLLCVASFNRVDLLCRLEKYAAAAPLLPDVRRLAIEQANQLDLTRLNWLDAKIRAGLGRKEEAMDLLEAVCENFTGREHPYDAGLSALDLAALKLEAGLTAEVRSIASRLPRIFTSKKIHREAIAALALFYEAAMADRATVELARQVIADIERVRRSASPSTRLRRGRGEEL